MPLGFFLLSFLLENTVKSLPTEWPMNNTSQDISQTPANVGENLGIAAFVLSLLILISFLIVLCWLGYQRCGDKLISSNTVAKGSPGPEKAPKEGLPQTESDGDVYMNYTGTNQAYSDLDPTNMTGDNVYSSLS